ncbi:tyrosine-protein phosphatase [Micromonospora mirobrigensis]|uniref:Protein tyrosine/serine phosphatase n=1 Tax=Micromonospora mirobrigensis TaxID=262898 RepID=A0A1C4VS05_9ACTN|nr:tyrosine-protein phosphatase [Micromonospora mirobrigensis]SCE86814.1 Protein tyrosine/serine phosphatase [Micromonospora mirobrigensis]
MPRLRWPDLRNARDLGGLPTVDGGRIRERALIRTDNHGRLVPAGIDAIRSYGVTRVIDLRWGWEAAKYPSPLAGDERYRLIPACFDPTGDEEIPPDSYRLMADTSRGRLAAALTAVAEAPPGGVVLHCHAGRDRTGLVAALALHVAGVAVESIAADYALTENSPPEMMVNTFAHLQARYGGVDEYLVGCGLAPGQLAGIRARLTEAAGGSPSALSR